MKVSNVHVVVGIRKSEEDFSVVNICVSDLEAQMLRDFCTTDETMLSLYTGGSFVAVEMDCERVRKLFLDETSAQLHKKLDEVRFSVESLVNVKAYKNTDPM